MNAFEIFLSTQRIVRKNAGSFISLRPKDIALQDLIQNMRRLRIKLNKLGERSAHSLVPYVRTSAIVETVLFLLGAVLLNAIFGDGMRFIAMPLHPFWAIVLLITVQYGPAEALMAAILSSAVLLVGNMPEQSLTETMYDYILRVSLTPFLWIMTALILGGVRGRQLNERKELYEQLAKSGEASTAILDTYKSIKKSKEQLELRLAEERCSVMAIYEIAKLLETLDPIEARIGIEKLVCTALNPKKFSLFVREGNNLVLEACYGWRKADGYKKKFDMDAPFVRHATAADRILSVVRPDEEKLLNGEGMLAGLLINEETDEVLGMLKIEEIGFTDMSIRNHETFRTICAWIAGVYANIEKYQAAVNKKRAASAEDKSSRAGSHAISKASYGKDVQESAA
jgi:hypothetical protein